MPSVGPQLPPHLVEKRKHNDEGEQSRSSSPDNASKRARVLGPAPPPAPLSERPPSRLSENAYRDRGDDSGSESSDDDFGPALPTAQNNTTASIAPATKAVQPQPAIAKRDDWMTIAPEHGDWSARVDPTKLKSRKFGTGKGPSVDAGAAESWHETPEQKQARLQREMMGVKDDSKGKPSRRAATKEEDPEDEARRKRIKEYNQARGNSLYQSHQKTTQQEMDDDPSARAFDREKDIGGGLQINSTQRRDMMKKASDFGSRFDSAKYL